MSVFYDNNITNKGRELLAELMSGASFKPTRIVMGQGYMPVGTTTRNITNVITPVKTMEINKSTKVPASDGIPEGSYVLGGMFSNDDVTADFYFRELGLYAKAVKTDGTETEEILYSYGNAGDDAERIPAYSATTVIEKQLDIITYIGNDTEVLLEIASGINVTQQEFNDTIEGINTNLQNLSNSVDERLSNVSSDIIKSVPAAGWDSDSTQTIAVDGITPAMKKPIIDVVAETVEEDDEWGKIWKIELLDGALKFYAKETPTLDLTAKIKVVM